MSAPRAPPIEELRMSSSAPPKESTPANQVAFAIGWRRKSHAQIAARKPFTAGKKAVLVALLYLSETESMKSPRHRQLPSSAPLLTTSLEISCHDSTSKQRANGTSDVITKQVNTMGSMRDNASLAKE